ncbi:hypothetical protein SH661x_002253 [Planctomicrobium sp. SH661]|uniref:hypothetical protein n=1 Tax=Planctomicrobium sp. SH661 TaxID=3448124 RepID=UPI003F5C81AE
MLSRYASVGVLMLAGAEMLHAADPLIPPAPSTDGNSVVPDPNPLPVPPLPPAPGLKSQPLLPVPEVNSPAPAVESIPQSVPSAPAPQMPVPQPVATPSVVPSHGTSPGQYVPVPSQGNAVAPNTSFSSPPYPSQGATYYYDNSGALVPFNPNAPYGFPQYNSFSTGPSYPVRMDTGPAGGEHARFPYYSYRRPWYTPGPVSRNVNIIW